MGRRPLEYLKTHLIQVIPQQRCDSNLFFPLYKFCKIDFFYWFRAVFLNPDPTGDQTGLTNNILLFYYFCYILIVILKFL